MTHLRLRWEADAYAKGYWICHYELVLTLNEHDLRREDANGKAVRDNVVIPLSKTRRGSDRTPDDAPFRDGCHAQWDSSKLGNLPVYVIEPNGREHLLADEMAAAKARYETVP